MTIRRGADWGASVEAPAGMITTDDAGAAALLIAALDSGESPPPIGLRSGDLARTMGGGTRERLDGAVVRAPIDVLEVEAGGESILAVAHVVARRWWWRGEVWITMNAQFIGPYDVAPRSHPNDGLVDVLHIDRAMPLRTRLVARRRARTGAHLPHPAIRTSRAASVHVRFDHPLTLWVDGVRWRRVGEVTVHVRPDAVVVHA